MQEVKFDDFPEETVPPISISEPRSARTVRNSPRSPRLSPRPQTGREYRVDRIQEASRRAFEMLHEKRIKKETEGLEREYRENERLKRFEFQKTLRKYSPPPIHRKRKDTQVLEKVVSKRRLNLLDTASEPRITVPFSTRPQLPKESTACYIPNTPRVFYWGI